MDRIASTPEPAVRPDAESVRLSDYHFDLPEALIAQEPAAQRDLARLLVLDRRSGVTAHSVVRRLPDYLRRGDLLVFNDTKVIPARLRGYTASGGKVELLFVRPLPETGEGTWLCLGKPARRLRPGTVLELPEGVQARVAESTMAGQYAIHVAAADVLPLLERHGEVPLPPYIKRPGGLRSADRNRYQTVYAAHPGAVAAPTAGLHFTPELLAALREMGIQQERLTLHVGPGTFLPIREDDARRHRMEAEWCEIPESTAGAIRRTKAAGGRVIAVGTTTTRALESAATPGPEILAAGERWADRFILPGEPLRVIDALFTNFHLPGSTLLLLVAALVGRERLLRTYKEAVAAQYRFYSYGDAMLIL
jgi:S-adenosylmethionine:tRNA ribosyltransferase-isomerase